jgi:hypothetical protein
LDDARRLENGRKPCRAISWFNRAYGVSESFFKLGISSYQSKCDHHNVPCPRQRYSKREQCFANTWTKALLEKESRNKLSAVFNLIQRDDDEICDIDQQVHDACGEECGYRDRLERSDGILDFIHDLL